MQLFGGTTPTGPAANWGRKSDFIEVSNMCFKGHDLTNENTVPRMETVFSSPTSGTRLVPQMYLKNPSDSIIKTATNLKMGAEL